MPNIGELVLLVSPKGKRYLRRLAAGQTLHTGDGVLSMEELTSVDYGQIARTHLGRPFKVQRPTLYEMVKGLKRQTQIIYPKDIGYLLLRLSVGPGRTIVEAGSGSGSLTMAMSWMAGPTGRIHTYEAREEFLKLCRKNLDWAGLGDNVTLTLRDIVEGFDETDADALFLDVREPWLYLDQAAAAVVPGAPLGFLLPTTNQVSDLVAGLDKGPFEEIEVIELMLRRYKPVSDRLRPFDRMVAHTGYLIFCRKTIEAGLMGFDGVEDAESLAQADPEGLEESGGDEDLDA